MKKKEEVLTYDAAITELEQIVNTLQSPNCEVDKLCELTARGVELLRFCREKLTRTDQELAKVIEGIGQ